MQHALYLCAKTWCCKIRTCDISNDDQRSEGTERTSSSILLKSIDIGMVCRPGRFGFVGQRLGRLEARFREAIKVIKHGKHPCVETRDRVARKRCALHVVQHLLEIARNVCDVAVDLVFRHPPCGRDLGAHAAPADV